MKPKKEIELSEKFIPFVIISILILGTLGVCDSFLNEIARWLVYLALTQFFIVIVVFFKLLFDDQYNTKGKFYNFWKKILTK